MPISCIIIDARHIQKLESNQVYIEDAHLPVGDNYRETFMRYLTEKIL